jgi:hypothetical protein
MRLSDAMMLGSTTCKMVAAEINTCALGAALNAMGFPNIDKKDLSQVRYDELRRLWPWLANEEYEDRDGYSSTGLRAVYSRFDFLVCAGKMTFEELVDYVRSIEPPEPEEQIEEEQELAVESIAR